MKINDSFPVKAEKPASRTSEQKPKTKGPEFQEIMRLKLGTPGVEFSKHARERLKSRNITLNNIQLEQLDLAVSLAKNKGAKDSLVLMGDTALIVNVGSRKVITAMGGADIKGNIFTGIDSAVILK